MSTGTLFAEAKHVEALRRMKLIRPEDRKEALKRMGLAVALGWLPLVILCVVHWMIYRDARMHALLIDIAVHVRFLLAVPLLIAVEYMVLPRLEAIGEHFGNAMLLPPSQRALFQSLMADSRRRSAGVWPSLSLALIVYAIVLLLLVNLSPDMMPAWQHTTRGTSLSVAGWWHLLVSLPLLLGLTLAWLWRLGIWIAFLWHTSRLRLCLVTSHPDHAGGLQFIAFSPRIFIPVVLAVSLVVAGTLANRVIFQGMSPVGHEAIPLVTTLIMILIFASPPLLFSRALVTAWRTGVFQYGELASRLGREFEKKWLDPSTTINTDSLERPDFSSTTDLFSIVSNTYAMRLVLLDLPGLVAIALSALLPFVPIWLSAIPFQTIVQHLVDFLF